MTTTHSISSDSHVSPADLWSLEPDVSFLNHGSFGACPKHIQEFQRSLRDQMERDPVEFLVRKLPGRLRDVREVLARFVGADADDLAFVPNATAGVNAVVRSLALGPGDELLTTNHAYGACLKTLHYVAGRCGAAVKVVDVPFPLHHEDEVVAPVLEAISPRTRLLMIDHVASPTALVFPLERIVREVQNRSVDVLVDGAHALGMLPIRLNQLGAAYYTANAHKWLCAPKGAAILHVRKDRQSAIHPPCISHGFDPASPDAKFRDEFDWMGTFDPTPWLCISECIRYFEELVPGGWDRIMRSNHDKALHMRRLVGAALEIPEPCPESMLGAMASIPLRSDGIGALVHRLSHVELTDWFRQRGVDAAFFSWPTESARLVRLSAQLYTTPADGARFLDVLREALRSHG